MFVKNLTGILRQSYSYVAAQNELSERLSLSVRSAGEFFCDLTYCTERRGMKQFLLLYTISGEGELFYHSKSYDLRERSVMLIDCDYPQIYRTKQDFWHFYYVHFTGTAAEALTKKATEGEKFAFYPECGKEIRELLENILKCKDILLPSESLKGCIMMEQIFQEILKTEETGAAEQAPLQNAIDYIHWHYAEKISLEELSKLALLSKFYFIRQFKRYTGSTPAEYLRAYRIARAQILLKTTPLSVEEIAAKVGYENASSFIRVFRSSIGCTPEFFREG